MSAHPAQPNTGQNFAIPIYTAIRTLWLSSPALHCRATGRGLRATLNCCTVTVKGEDTGQVNRKEARGMKEIMAGQLHLEPTEPAES